METQIVFLRKVRSTRSTWEYIAGTDRGTLTMKDEDIIRQFSNLADIFCAAFGKNISIISPQLVKRVQAYLFTSHPETLFVPVDPSLSRIFDRAFIQAPRRRTNPNTLYVCSDASGGHMNVPAAWAWCSSGAGVQGNYGVGYSGKVTTNVAELEGLLSAIVAHAEHPADDIRLYCDSTTAVDDVAALAVGATPKAVQDYNLWDLSDKAVRVMDSRTINVAWVKGHREHRLNSMADNLSRFARQRFNHGQQYSDFKAEVDAIYSMVN